MNTTKQLHKFTVLPSYYEAVAALPVEQQNEFLGAIMRYGVAGIKPEFDNPLMTAMFELVKPNIDKSIKFHSKQKANGDKGGRPKNPKQSMLSDNKNPEKPKTLANKNPTATHSKPNSNPNKTYDSDSDSDSDSESESESEQYRVANATLSQPPAVGGRDRRLEFEFYLWCFNKLFGREFTLTAGRYRKYQSRRKVFNLEDVITSLQVMAGEPFYQGQGQTDRDSPWRASPDYHLGKDENIAKFLEMENSGAEREYIKGRLPDLKREFMQTRQIADGQAQTQKGVYAST